MVGFTDTNWKRLRKYLVEIYELITQPKREILGSLV